MCFQGADRFQFLRGEAEEVPELPNRADGMLRLPAPVIPLGIGHVAPERMASGFTGRFFLLATSWGLGERPGHEPGTLFGFVHRSRCLQKTSMSSSPRRLGATDWAPR